jgi:hypothetical protein
MKSAKGAKDSPRNRGVYFCIGYSTFWNRPVHKILKVPKNRHHIRWLRILMSYHRFPNIRDVFQSHLSAKMIENVESLDFLTRDCNCRPPAGFENALAETFVEFQLWSTQGFKYIDTENMRIGKTQQFFKNRSDVRSFPRCQAMCRKGHSIRLTYAKHFGGRAPSGAKAFTPGNPTHIC